jgi:ABC-type transport system involved in multi-copper enzyme maturation permease subunit
MQMFLIEQVIVGWIGASITLLVSVIITAFFIPNMLRKGTVDMLIVKPMWRGTLLIYKFIGGLTFMFVNTFVAVFIIWFALGLKSGIWATAIFWMVPVLTFSFAVLYAVSTLFAVLTRSAIVAILMTAFAWMALWVVSVMHQFVEAERMREEREKVVASQAVSQSLFGQIVYAVHYVLPRRGDLDSLTTRLLFEDLLTANQIKLGKFDKAKISWQESVTVSCIHIAWMLAVSCWWFSVKDY